uniref:Uncharacterized protein n=1 Tax=Arundo donax TaxID=35708 RepID=A0A0A8YV20_ARUDO
MVMMVQRFHLIMSVYVVDCKAICCCLIFLHITLVSYNPSLWHNL